MKYYNNNKKIQGSRYVYKIQYNNMYKYLSVIIIL